MNQCWNIVNSNHREKHLWNLNPNWYIFIQDNRFENSVCEIVSILSRPQYVYYTIIPPTLHCESSIAYIWSLGISWNPQSSMSLVITYLVKSWMKLLIHSHTPRCNGWSLEMDKYFHPTFHNRVMHTCASKLIIIGSDNSLSPCRRRAIIWTNAGILLIRTIGKNFCETLTQIDIFSFKIIGLKMSCAKLCQFCLVLNMFITP